MILQLFPDSRQIHLDLNPDVFERVSRANPAALKYSWRAERPGAHDHLFPRSHRHDVLDLHIGPRCWRIAELHPLRRPSFQQNAHDRFAGQNRQVRSRLVVDVRSRCGRTIPILADPFGLTT